MREGDRREGGRGGRGCGKQRRVVKGRHTLLSLRAGRDSEYENTISIGH